MKVYVQIVDKSTGIYQTGGIEEPVASGKEIENALLHFGVSYGSVIWENPNYGKVDGTSKELTILWQQQTKCMFIHTMSMII